MYNPPPSSSSPPQNHPVSGGLTRYVSAPGSFLSRVADSVIGNGRDQIGSSTSSFLGHHQQHQYNFSSDSSSLTCESTCKVNSSNDQEGMRNGGNQLSRSYGLNEFEGGSLVRQKSSPAGFLSHLAYDNTNNNGFSITRETGGGYNLHGGHAVSRLKSQSSFTRGDSLSQISEGSGSGVDGSSGNGHQNSSHSYPTVSYGFESWENSISFSGPTNKRIKNVEGDVYNCLNVLEAQFSMPETSLEMATVEKLLNIPEDSVPCKIRAKRGCATHPRSIAERERRTRISGRLKKLQDLVPNMDKQTSYSDMLDLAVQHIKGLQNDIQKIRKEMEHCTCGCKPSS